MSTKRRKPKADVRRQTSERAPVRGLSRKQLGVIAGVLLEKQA